MMIALSPSHIPFERGRTVRQAAQKLMTKSDLRAPRMWSTNVVTVGFVSTSASVKSSSSPLSRSVFGSSTAAPFRDVATFLHGSMGGVNLRAAMGPRSCDLKLAGETEQGAFVRGPTDKLHADGQSTGAFRERQRHGRLTRNVEGRHIDVVLAHAGPIVGLDVQRHVIEAQWTRALRQRRKQYRIETRGHRRDVARRDSDSLNIKRVLDSARGAAFFDARPRDVGQLVGDP